MWNVGQETTDIKKKKKRKKKTFLNSNTKLCMLCIFMLTPDYYLFMYLFTYIFICLLFTGFLVFSCFEM